MFINNHPIANPIAIFNPSFTPRNDYETEVYARITVGYCFYVSAIVKTNVPISYVLGGAINIG